MTDTNTITSHCQNKWRIICHKSDSKVLSIGINCTDIPHLLNHCYVDYLCNFFYSEDGKFCNHRR